MGELEKKIQFSFNFNVVFYKVFMFMYLMCHKYFLGILFEKGI